MLPLPVAPCPLAGLATFPADSLSVRSPRAGLLPARSATHGIPPLPQTGDNDRAGCLRLNPFHTSSKNPLPEKYLARRKQVIFASWRWNEPLLPAAAMRIRASPEQEGRTQVRGLRGRPPVCWSAGKGTDLGDGTGQRSAAQS